jgi:phosphotriesterase-related protein
MATVSTVSGPIDTSQLGVTLMHEHVFVLSTEIQRNFQAGWDEERRVADAIARLAAAKARVVDTIVDPTVVGLGRDVARVRRVAAAAGVQLLVATGLYTYDELPFYFRFRGPGTIFDGPEPMVELFARDVEEGIAGTGVKAAMLKCAADAEGLTPGVERVLRAVAQAHRRTGAPVTVHTHPASRNGLEVQRVLREEGVDLTRVVIGHSGDTDDLAYLEELLAAGSFIGMDRFGLDAVLPFEARVRTVAALCERGFAGRMVLSHDSSCYIDWLPEEALPLATPNWHLLHIHDDVLPALRERGVTDEQLDTMLVGNPRRFFEQQDAY